MSVLLIALLLVQMSVHLVALLSELYSLGYKAHAPFDLSPIELNKNTPAWWSRLPALHLVNMFAHVVVLISEL